MRRSIVRLIARREIRDLLRDRRTLIIILLLPALLYPAFVAVGLAFAVSLMDQKTVIGVVGSENIPRTVAHPESVLVGGALIVEADRKWDDPPLMIEGQFPKRYIKSDGMSGNLVAKPLATTD